MGPNYNANLRSGILKSSPCENLLFLHDSNPNSRPQNEEKKTM